MSCTKVGLFKVSILFETFYYTQYQGRVCATSKASYKHMYMYIFIIIILVIVNNYPVTKNKPIYQVRISKQMKGRAFSEPFHLLTVRA